MKRRDFISLFNVTWASILGLFLSQKTVKLPTASTFTRETALKPGEKFELPSDPWDGFSLRLTVGAQAEKQPAMVSCFAKHSIENQTQEIEMDVAGVYQFTFVKEGRFWAVESFYPEASSSKSLS